MNVLLDVTIALIFEEYSCVKKKSMTDVLNLCNIL